MNRRRATALIALSSTGFLFGCRQQTLSPSASRLQPLDIIVSGNGNLSEPAYHSYANGGESLIQAMRNFGLSPELIPARMLGAGTFRLSSPSEFGWIFAVENVVFGQDASSITLSHDQLWAAYRKRSLG